VGEIKAVTFKNAAGQLLYGTLHEPAAVNRALPVVVLLSPGVKMRVGPGRLYVPLTEMLCAEGYRVLRFDFFGLGDSEGELQEKLLPDVYNHIEVGRYVDDTLAAMRFLREKHGATRFVLGGLCGGAITGLLAAQRDQSAVGMLSLGMTVTLASNAATPGKYLTSKQLEGRRKKYFKKLLSPKAWWRFITFQSEMSVIWHSVLRMFVKKKPQKAAVAPAAAPMAPAVGAPGAATPATVAAAAAEQRGNANPLFPPAYFAFLERGGKAFMLFSGKDRLQSEYEEKFAQPFAERLTPYTTQIHQHVVPNANHVLSLHEWQREMVEQSREWMRRHYPVAA
jgi:pimeloyl-ACP methyl ester carboxylesterase